jgi:ArsR family transcriptional regulator
MIALDHSAGLLSLLADPTRVRLLAILAEQELTVAELTAVTGLAQSRVSTHLAKLREAGLLRDRRAGASSFHRINGAMPVEAARLWAVVKEQLRDPLLLTDRRRTREVLAAREGRWPDSIAGQMERHYSPGRTWESLARGLLPLVRLGDVLDVGCGDGTTAAMLAPRARSYTAIDVSPTLLAAARRRLEPGPEVTLLCGDMHALPFAGGRFDQVLMFHVLTCTEEPRRALSEAARVLRPGGELTVLTLREHGHLDVTAAYGHVLPGVVPQKLGKMMERAGFRVGRCAVESRERRRPFFEVVAATATRES